MSRDSIQLEFRNHPPRVRQYPLYDFRGQFLRLRVHGEGVSGDLVHETTLPFLRNPDLVGLSIYVGDRNPLNLDPLVAEFVGKQLWLHSGRFAFDPHWIRSAIRGVPLAPNIEMVRVVGIDPWYRVDTVEVWCDLFRAPVLDRVHGVSWAKSVSPALRETCRFSVGIRVLDFTTTPLTDRQFMDLVDVLVENTRVEELNLLGSRVHPTIRKYLYRLLTENRTLERLSLGDCPLHDAGVASVAQALTGGNRTLKKLELYGVKAGALGAEALAGALRVNPVLEELDLSSNVKLGRDGGWRHLSSALVVNEGLRKLNLGHTNPPIEDMEGMLDMLARNETLEELNMSRGSVPILPGRVTRGIRETLLSTPHPRSVLCNGWWIPRDVYREARSPNILLGGGRWHPSEAKRVVEELQWARMIKRVLMEKGLGEDAAEYWGNLMAIGERQ